MRGYYGHPRFPSVGQGPPQPVKATEQPTPWGKWVVRGIGAAAILGVGLMANSAFKSMKRTDTAYKSKGLKSPFGT